MRRNLVALYNYPHSSCLDTVAGVEMHTYAASGIHTMDDFGWMHTWVGC